jgi:hypothetical protein
MFKLDNDFLQSLGLGGLPVDEKNRLLQMIYERLEMNVGMRLAEKMSDQQLDEFEGFIDRNDEGGALKWLETNFPNYKDVVAEELEKLKGEVQASAPQILAAAQTFPVQPGSSMPPANGAPGQLPGQPFNGAQGGPPAPQQFAAPQPPAPQPQYGQPVAPPAGGYNPYQQQPMQPSGAPHQPGFPTEGPSPQPYSPSPMPPTPGYTPQQPQMPQTPQPDQQQPNPQPFDPPAGGLQGKPFDPTQGQQFTPPPPGFTPGQ